MSSYTYSHPEGKGLGQHHAEAASRELPAEMRDLDMPSGTAVEHVATDEATGAVIVSWTDKGGVLRHSSVAPGFFAVHFKQDGQAV